MASELPPAHPRKASAGRRRRRRTQLAYRIRRHATSAVEVLAFPFEALLGASSLGAPHTAAAGLIPGTTRRRMACAVAANVPKGCTARGLRAVHGPLTPSHSEPSC